MTTVGDLERAMGAIAPLELAASWDNVGLLVGDPGQVVASCLLCIDVTDGVLEEARARDCQAIVAYHPVLFAPTKRLLAPSLPFRAVREGIAIYSPHTALDVARGGTNDALAEALGLLDVEPLVPTGRDDLGPLGFGRVGRVEELPVDAFLLRVRTALETDGLLVAGGAERIRRVAVFAGAGAEGVATALARGVDAYVTGELRHHDALRFLGTESSVITTRHSVTERICLPRLARALAERLPTISFLRSESDRDPFRFA